MVEHMFDTGTVSALSISRIHTGSDAVRSAAALIDRDDLLPAPTALGPLLPDGGLRRGSTLAVAGAGATSLAFALLAEITAEGGWCAAVGVPSLGLLAANHAGVDLSRLALVTAPGPDWPTIVAALLDAFEIVLLGRLDPVATRLQRRLAIRLRDRGRVLMTLGSAELPHMPADVRLFGAAATWDGLEQGAGHLRRRQVRIRAEGHRLAGCARHATVWLPDIDGRLTATPDVDGRLTATADADRRLTAVPGSPGLGDRPMPVEASA